MLAGYRLPGRTTSALRQMTGPRQLAAAHVMAGANNSSGDLARALLAATPASQRADDPRGRQSDRHRARLLSGMEKGLTHMQETVRSLHTPLLTMTFTVSLSPRASSGAGCRMTSSRRGYLHTLRALPRHLAILYRHRKRRRRPGER